MIKKKARFGKAKGQTETVSAVLRKKGAYRIDLENKARSCTIELCGASIAKLISHLSILLDRGLSLGVDLDESAFTLRITEIEGQLSTLHVLRTKTELFKLCLNGESSHP